MQLMFVTTGLGLGGAEVQLVQLAMRLKRRGWEITLISLAPPQFRWKELDEAGIPVRFLDFHNPLAAPVALFRLAYEVNRLKPQIVHAHMIHANILTRLVRLLTPVPALVCTAHSMYEISTRAKELREVTWRELAYRFTDPLCDLTTQVSRAGLARYVRIKAVPKHKACFVPNGVDTERFSPNPEARARLRDELGLQDFFVWLTVGRLEPPKDHFTLIRAFSYLLSKKGEAKLLIAGQGSLMPELEALAENLGVTSKVLFLGARRDIPELASTADAFVLSSAWEGLPLTLLEAMACELPIIATDSGGPREILQNGRWGILVPPRNPEALAEAMLQVMSLPAEERLQMGKAARRHVENNYSFERIVDRWEEIYRQLLAFQGGKPHRTGLKRVPDIILH